MTATRAKSILRQVVILSQIEFERGFAAGGLCPKTTRAEPVAQKAEGIFCVPLALPVLEEQI